MDAVLPEFELDCRDWIVSRPGECGALDADSDGGAPVLAVLSTLVIDDDLREATGAITVGLIDDADHLRELSARPVRPGATAREVPDVDPGTRRYVMPTPADPAAGDGPRIALLAEFTVPADRDAELGRRVDALMGSFRWHAA